MNLGRVVPLLLLSGCLSVSESPTNPTVPSPPLIPIRGDVLVQDHDHSDPHLHTGRVGLQLVSFVPRPKEITPPGLSFTELDLRDGYAYVCKAGNDRSRPVGGFEIVDVRSVESPRIVGVFEGPGCFDIKANDRGDLVFFGTQRNPPSELLAGAEEGRYRESVPRAIYLVNVSDKSHPFVESITPLPVNGVHTLHYVSKENKELLFVQTYDWIPDAGLGVDVSTGIVNPLTQRSEIYEVVRSSDGTRSLRLLSTFSLREIPPQGKNYFPHDVTVQKHPKTGTWIAYVAYWDLGVVLVDVTDPTHPKEISRFSDTSPSSYVQIHQARPFGHLIDGRHVTVLEPELPQASESGQFTLIDTTDPSRPQKLGYWTLPGHLVIPGGFLFSPHNFNLAHGRIYLAHNHAGVWVVDVHNETLLKNPQAVAYFEGAPEVRKDCPMAGRYWSAFYASGYVFATDSCSGLVILRYEGDAPDPSEPFEVMPRS